MEEILSIVNSIRNLFITGDEDNDDLCVVCYDNLRNITFYTCKHDNCCERCYLQLTPKKCPYCRADIKSTDCDFKSEDEINQASVHEQGILNLNRLFQSVTEEEINRALEEINNTAEEELDAYYDYLAWTASYF